MIGLALEVMPQFACLVPENREEVTTEGGLDVAGARAGGGGRDRRGCRMRASAVSLFIDPDLPQIEAAARIGAEMVELHTGCFANASDDRRPAEIGRLTSAARAAHAAGIQVNAGHGINYRNLPELFAVPHLVELNIGHSIVSRAMRVGFEQAVREMKEAMEGYGMNIDIEH